MMQSAATRRAPQRSQQALTRSLAACVGGWNDRDSLAQMDEKDAVILANFFPKPSRVVLRKGSAAWVTGITGQVESLMGYRPQTGTAALFAAAGTSFYNVTSSGAVGAAVVTGLTNARWQHVNMATSGGNFLMALNGADKLRGWNGSAWWADGDGTHDISGVDTATCIFPALFKRRLWMVQKNTLKVWYLPVDSIAGAATSIDFGPIMSRGGSLVAMADWSLDAGVGIDDYAAFISDQGEIAIYKGSDPSSATTWALVGVFYVGAPVGNRPVCSFAGDVLLIGKDGLVPLSKALMSSRVNTQISLTDKIQNTVSSATTSYAANFGWQVLLFPGENMVLLNVPVASGAQEQYVMNTISGAWCRFTGWPANCFELYGNELYFGMNGKVCKAWTGTSDQGNAITAEALQAFSYFGSRGTLKEWTLARPLIAIDNTTSFLFGLNTDFDETAPTGVPTFVQITGSTWNSGTWGTATWSGDPALQKLWQTVYGIGNCAAVHIIATSATASLEWSATDFAYKNAGVL